MNYNNYYYLHCVTRLTAIIVIAEVIAMLIFDSTGLDDSLPPLIMALLDGLLLICLSIYPLYRLVYMPIVERFQKSQQKIEMLAEALQGAGDSVVITDPDGGIIYVNQAFTDVTGYTYEDVRGKNPSILQSGKQDRDFYARMWGAIKSTDKWKGELWNKRKNGELYPEALDIRAIHNKNGDIKFFVGVFSDLTEKKRVENALIQSQKLEAVGTLVGGVAHNFNNLLAAISGKAYLGYIKARKLDANAPFTRHLEDIQHIAFDAAALVKQLLAFSRESQHDKQDIPLSILVKDAIETAKIGVPEDVEIITNITDEMLMVHADPVHLKQAIINLINNARDAVEHSEQKRISVKLSRLSDDTKCAHSEACHIHCNEVAVLDIEDTGCGINSADIDKLFEPFFTTKEVGKGTGLGLSTAHGIIMSHNGSINVKSTFSKGATFNICLPLVDQSELKADKNNITQNIETQYTGTVLLVDDDNGVRKTMASLLESLGHDVIQASDGIESVDKFRQHQDSISVVVTDIVMPRKDGIDSVLEMRKLNAELPAIFMTGYDASRQETKDILQNETTMLLSKPFKTSELNQAIDKLINRYN